MSQAPEFHYTPIDICKKLLEDINFVEGDTTLEPCKGRGLGNFYQLIPYEKDWAEVDENPPRDIFTYDFGRLFSKLILNPPYKCNAELKKDRKNITIKFVFRCLELCSDECWVLLNLQMLNSLTPIRLKKIEEMGFGIVFMRIINIPKWFGRYYWICFKKDSPSMIKY